MVSLYLTDAAVHTCNKSGTIDLDDFLALAGDLPLDLWTYREGFFTFVTLFVEYEDADGPVKPGGIYEQCRRYWRQLYPRYSSLHLR